VRLIDLPNHRTQSTKMHPAEVHRADSSQRDSRRVLVLTEAELDMSGVRPLANSPGDLRVAVQSRR
jgi:hypothetical protein